MTNSKFSQIANEIFQNIVYYPITYLQVVTEERRNINLINTDNINDCTCPFGPDIIKKEMSGSGSIFNQNQLRLKNLAK